MLELIAPESYRQASRAEIEARTNGCGPEGWRLAIVEMLNSLVGLDISEACRIHDWCYGHGVKGDEDGRLDDDIMLYCNIAILVLQAGGDKRPVRMAGAAAMYVAVRNGGAEHYGAAA